MTESSTIRRCSATPASSSPSSFASSSSPSHRPFFSLFPIIHASSSSPSSSSSSAAPLPSSSSSFASSPPSAHHVVHRPSLYLISGAVAGLSVDLVLFPLDTIKTRMQSTTGLSGTGGFRKLFAGIASAAAGSAPTAALFFVTYEVSKQVLTPIIKSNHSSSPSSSSVSPVHPLVHCLSASFGELIACVVRVPTDNVKQKVQAGFYPSSFACFQSLARTGARANFYRGFGPTIAREVPFAIVQFSLYEWMKFNVARYMNQDREQMMRTSSSSSSSSSSNASSLPAYRPVDGWMCAAIGSLSGGVAAALTTPLDVVKTRIMLHQHASTSTSSSLSSASPSSSSLSSHPSFLSTFRSIYRDGGMTKLFSGVLPRVMWISMGGFVFFGAYEGTKSKIEQLYKDE